MQEAIDRAIYYAKRVVNALRNHPTTRKLKEHTHPWDGIQSYSDGTFISQRDNVDVLLCFESICHEKIGADLDNTLHAFPFSTEVRKRFGLDNVDGSVTADNTHTAKHLEAYWKAMAEVAESGVEIQLGASDQIYVAMGTDSVFNKRSDGAILNKDWDGIVRAIIGYVGMSPDDKNKDIVSNFLALPNRYVWNVGPDFSWKWVTINEAMARYNTITYTFGFYEADKKTKFDVRQLYEEDVLQLGSDAVLSDIHGNVIEPGVILKYDAKPDSIQYGLVEEIEDRHVITTTGTKIYWLKARWGFSVAEALSEKTEIVTENIEVRDGLVDGALTVADVTIQM